MIARRPLLTLAILVASFAGAANGQENGQTPLELLAALQNVQTRIAQGDKAAYAAQPALLHDMGVAISSANPDVWKKSDNVHAAVAFLLSGGPPRAVAPLTQIEGMPKEDDQLLHGALAYVVGRQEEAQKLLGGVDPRTMDLRLAGQIAFVQSMLAFPADKKKSIELLDLARLLSPGGLVEEAALRREISVAADMHDVDRFTVLSAQYLNRFSKSVYAESFTRSIGPMVARLGLAEEVVNFHKFDGLALALPPDMRRDFYLTVARAALVDGKVEAADVAARVSTAGGLGDGVDEARARLYGAAARMFGEKYDQSVADLNAIDAKRLPKRDAALLGAAREVAARLRETPTLSTTSPSASSADPNSNKTTADAMTTIRLAEAAVARSDSLINEKPR